MGGRRREEGRKEEALTGCAENGVFGLVRTVVAESSMEKSSPSREMTITSPVMFSGLDLA